jgi:hypothetical protein
VWPVSECIERLFNEYCNASDKRISRPFVRVREALAEAQKAVTFSFLVLQERRKAHCRAFFWVYRGRLNSGMAWTWLISSAVAANAFLLFD